MIFKLDNSLRKVCAGIRGFQKSLFFKKLFDIKTIMIAESRTWKKLGRPLWMSPNRNALAELQNFALLIQEDL